MKDLFTYIVWKGEHVYDVLTNDIVLH